MTPVPTRQLSAEVRTLWVREESGAETQSWGGTPPVSVRAWSTLQVLGPGHVPLHTQGPRELRVSEGRVVNGGREPGLCTPKRGWPGGDREEGQVSSTQESDGCPVTHQRGWRLPGTEALEKGGFLVLLRALPTAHLGPQTLLSCANPIPAPPPLHTRHARRPHFL